MTVITHNFKKSMTLNEQLEAIARRLPQEDLKDLSAFIEKALAKRDGVTSVALKIAYEQLTIIYASCLLEIRSLSDKHLTSGDLDDLDVLKVNTISHIRMLFNRYRAKANQFAEEGASVEDIVTMRDEINAFNAEVKMILSNSLKKSDVLSIK